MQKHSAFAKVSVQQGQYCKSFLLKNQCDKPCSNAMQVATKVITSWLPSIAPAHRSAEWTTAVYVSAEVPRSRQISGRLFQ